MLNYLVIKGVKKSRHRTLSIIPIFSCLEMLWEGRGGGTRPKGGSPNFRGGLLKYSNEELFEAPKALKNFKNIIVLEKNQI